jgi:hypothetical protein
MESRDDHIRSLHSLVLGQFSAYIPQGRNAALAVSQIIHDHTRSRNRLIYSLYVHLESARPNSLTVSFTFKLPICGS